MPPRPRWNVWLAALLALSSASCARPEDLCAPVNDRIGFFSQGDCVFTRARFFRGHEWITAFGNAELPEAERFSEAEVQWMALGNRRVDYPQELLVHLDNGILAYVEALTERTERPDQQQQHFLLRGDDSERAAADAALEHIFSTTEAALRRWGSDRVRALTLLGQAQHTVQDSFSPAHTVRRSEESSYGVLPGDAERLGQPVAMCEGSCGCLLRVKAYLRRDSEFREGVLYHGTVSLGYLFKNTYEVGVFSHNLFAEVGHTWVIHRTLRLSLGVGLRRILRTQLAEESVFTGPETDAGAVQREIERIEPWLPLGAIRFSRAF